MSGRLAAFTVAALIGFAANSLLTRGALAAGRIDAASFLALRLAAGAAMLWLLSRSHPRRAGADPSSSWPAALALAGYGVFFTFAYLRIGAGLGALTLFGAVQATMIAAGLRAGERPSWLDIGGLTIAIAGLLTLTVPGAAAPPLVGILTMAAGGACWGLYSLQGRRSSDPLVTTADNFLRATPIGLAVLALQWRSAFATPLGVTLAVISGALTSGVGYAVWYAALPQLTAWRAAVIQLLVPVLTVAAAIVMLGESMSMRIAIAGALIISGVLLSLTAPRSSGGARA
ncbi:MAG: DMT family transporter [Acidobacteria bacterium]|nr:MAG: DMT family transporter [Acidobacteriota bacterium]